MWEGDEWGIDRSEGGSWSSEVSECECRAVQVLVLIRLSSVACYVSGRSFLERRLTVSQDQSRSKRAHRVSQIFAFASQWT